MVLVKEFFERVEFKTTKSINDTLETVLLISSISVAGCFNNYHKEVKHNVCAYFVREDP